MKKILLCLALFCPACLVYGQVNKVQHITAHMPDAAEIFKLFNQSFGVPAVYDYQSFGSFSSGGLWLGNVTFETVGANGDDRDSAFFRGIALEPAAHTNAVDSLLDKIHINHSAPQISYWNYQGSKQKFYTVTDLTDLCAGTRRVFICDYEQRDFINGFSLKADSAFNAAQGGSLGLLGVKAVVIQTTNLAKQVALWKTIPGIKVKDAYRFGFETGPDVLVEPGPQDQIKEIVLKVRSSAKAAAFLAKENYLKKEGNTLMIDPGKLHGLRIILEE